MIGRRSPRALAEGQLGTAIDRADRLGIPVIGETAFLNLLGLTDRRPGLAEEAKGLAGHGVNVNLARLLALFDIIDPAEELHARQALKEVRRALADGMEAQRLLCELLHEPERLRARLPSLTLARDEAGRLGQRIAGRLADLDGQLRLDLARPPGPSTDALFEAAERAEAAGSWANAEQLYGRCLAREPADATLHFNLGNVLREQGRLAEATAAFAKAATIDPEMAEAWFNLAGLAEVEKKHVDATRRYRRALAIDPDYADALFNLARLETEREEFIDALPRGSAIWHWTRKLAGRPRPQGRRLVSAGTDRQFQAEAFLGGLAVRARRFNAARIEASIAHCSKAGVNQQPKKRSPPRGLTSRGRLGVLISLRFGWGWLQGAKP